MIIPGADFSENGIRFPNYRRYIYNDGVARLPLHYDGAVLSEFTSLNKTIVIEGYFRGLRQSSTYQGLFSVYNTDNGLRGSLTFAYISSSSSFRAQSSWGKSSTDSVTAQWEAGEYPITIDADNVNITFQGSTLTNFYASAQSLNQFYLFNKRTLDQTYANVYYYVSAVKVYDPGTGTLQAYYRPAIDENDVACMIETISGTYCYADSGSLVATNTLPE